MLVQVMKSKLVLGRSVYKKGDVFECRDAEAKALIQVGMLKASAPDAKVSKTPPQPAKIGISLAKDPKAVKQPSKLPGKPIGAMLAPQKEPETVAQPAAKKEEAPPKPGHPVGEMQMPEQRGSATEPRPWVK